MPHIDIEILKPLVLRFIADCKLTPSERVEVLRIAQGFACKDSAAAADVSPETIRARRKRLYRKVGACGSSDVTARLLGLSLGMIAAGERLEATQPASAAFAPAPVQILQAAL
jgi:DNA-binding CsgD family transcriptional regulator